MKNAERENLRTELQFLKDCQVRYFFLSVTAAGAVAGFGEKMTSIPGGPSIYLAPLLIILPCWWIFFDKATTISRIVAYLRILEHSILRDARTGSTGYEYVGWENALERYRLSQAGDKVLEKVRQYLDGIESGLAFDINAFPDDT